VHHLFGYNDRQINLVDWYPFIVPYSGGWLLHPPAEVGEHLVYDEANFDVTLSLTDPTLPITLAASSLAEVAAGSWHYLLENSRTFVFSAGTAYQTASTAAGGLTVTSYYFREEEIPAHVVLDETARALTTFGVLFGPYPHPSLSIVETPFYDGMEYDGLFFLSRDYYTAYDGTVLNLLIDIAVHETAHQWWFGSVGNDQALVPWLDEALATYSEKLFYEKNYPGVTAWWAFRVDPYAPAGWVDTDIYNGSDFQSYANAVYLRGAQFLEALRGRISDEAFFAFLKDYAAQMSGKRATAEDFFRILRYHTSADLSDIVTSYLQQQYQGH
ncbi:MAG: M1 family aminopeptidase, partial [Chloroflexi bacterium]|nr:M1 family aminopeptidase [Chloroflexota bacterium]